jgi:hypothetical protein
LLIGLMGEKGDLLIDFLGEFDPFRG